MSLWWAPLIRKRLPATAIGDRARLHPQEDDTDWETGQWKNTSFGITVRESTYGALNPSTKDHLKRGIPQVQSCPPMSTW